MYKHIINWIISRSFEYNCTDADLDWKIKKVSKSEIDTEKSLKNNARTGGHLDLEHVSSCSIAMKNGRPIEYIALRYVPGEPYMVIGGNHRIGPHFL